MSSELDKLLENTAASSELALAAPAHAVSAQAMQLIDLPIEILTNIVLYLDVRARAKLAQVSKLFRDVVKAEEDHAQKLLPDFLSIVADEPNLAAAYKTEACISKAIKFSPVLPLNVKTGFHDVVATLQEIQANTKEFLKIYENQMSFPECRYGDYFANVKKATTIITDHKINFSMLGADSDLRCYLLTFFNNHARSDAEDLQYEAELEADLLKIFTPIIAEADVNQTDKDGATLLHHIMRRFGIEGLIDLFVENGADLNIQTTVSVKGSGLFSWGDVQLTPLHIAIMFGNAGAVKALIKHGADIFIQESNGLTALEIAKKVPEYVENPQAVIKLLTAAEAEANLKCAVLDEHNSICAAEIAYEDAYLDAFLVGESDGLVD